MHEGKCPTITFHFESYIQIKIWSEYKSRAYFQLWLIYKMFTEFLQEVELLHSLENELL